MTIQHLFPTSKPTLDLNFAAERQLDPRITFTRSTVGTYVDDYGIVQTAAVDEPRFDHDGGTGESLGLLIEDSRANIYKYSNLMNPSSGSTPSNFTANAGTAPDGTNTALKLVQKPSSDGVALQGQTFAIGTKNVNAVFSVFAKAGEDRYLYITPYLSVSLNPPVFDLQTGTISDPDGHNAVMTPLADGWYRCSVQVSRFGFSSIKWGISNVADAPTSQNGIPFEGDGTSGLLVWGAQYELQTPTASNGDSPIGTSATSYIYTSGSNVTRGTDVADMTGTNFSSWYDQNGGTFCCDFYSKPTYAMSLSIGTFLYSLHEVAGTGDRINFTMKRDATTSIDGTGRFFIEVSGSTQLSATQDESIVYGEVCKTALSYEIGDAGVATQGVNKNLTAGPPSALPAVTILTLGDIPSRYETNKRMLNGHIARFSYYPRRLSDEQLQALTA